jgi:superfamily II DNA/RNA helicase
LEQILTIMRTPAISAAVAPGEKVIIYSMLRGGGIMEALVGKMRSEGHGVLVYDGEQERDIKKDILHQFTTMGPLAPNVLLCTDAMATGIDRLQYVCSKVIFNILPWTFAQYEQLIGRVWRQGQRQQVEVVLPIPYVRTASGRVWSYDMSKLRRLFDKRTLADAAVNGNLPDHLLEDQAKMRGRLRRALESWSGQDLIAD